MTLKEFIENLAKLAEENPKTLDMQVVTSSDDEGNDFNTVYHTPTMGVYEDREFHTVDADDPDSEIGPEDINAVCVN